MPEQPTTPVDAFVAETRQQLYGTWWTRRRIAEEFHGHLDDSVDALIRDGLGRDEAERRAIQRFGSASMVARSLAQERGVGIATEFTRWGGAAASAGAVGIAVTRILQELSWSYSRGSYAETSFLPKVLFVFGVAAMYRRVRGHLGPWARRGFRLGVAGFVGAFVSSLAWFPLGSAIGLTAMAAGLAVYLIAVLRSSVFPTGAMTLLVGAVAGTFILGVGGTVTGVDTGAVTSAVGSIAAAAAMSWVGLWLWTERDRLEPAAGRSAAAAAYSS